MELRSFIPALRGIRGGKRTRLPVEEGKDLVLPDRTSQTTSVLVETILITVQTTTCWRARMLRAETVPTLVRIESWARSFEKCAAVQVVGAALRGDLDLRAAETPILRVVAVGHYFHVLNR